MKPIHADLFYHEGRGPQLVKVYWCGRGQVLKAIDFIPPDAEKSEDISHLIFEKPQVVEIIPEEVIGYSDLSLNEALTNHGPAALFDAGKSEWLKSFSPTHLSRCTHYRIMFYDELFEVIAESVEARKGKYENGG